MQPRERADGSVLVGTKHDIAGEEWQEEQRARHKRLYLVGAFVVALLRQDAHFLGGRVATSGWLVSTVEHECDVDEQLRAHIPSPVQLIPTWKSE